MAQTDVAGSNGYGKFSIDAAGAWTYTMNGAHDEFVGGQDYTDSITVATADGTEQLITVTIHGTNDAAVITGTSTGSVVEASPSNGGGTPTATGDLLADAVDNAANSFQVINTATTSLGGYGTFTTTAGGLWTYTLDNSNPTVNALNNSQALADSFVVHSTDGTAKTVNITINGATDVVDVLAPTDIKFALDVASATAQSGNHVNAGANLGAISAVDADSTSWTYSLTGTDASSFALTPSGATSTATISVGGSNLTFGSYTFQVIATDGAGHAYGETFNVWVGSSGGDGTTAAPILISSGSDIDFGLNGADVISGGAGEDAIVGGQNRDTINGDSAMMFLSVAN